MERVNGRDTKYVALVATQSKVQLNDRTAYALRKDRPLYLLQRICTWVLDKLGCYRSTAVVQTNMIQVESASLGQAISRQIVSLRRAWDIQTYTIIIGRDSMAEFMSEVTPYPIFMGLPDQVRLAYVPSSRPGDPINPVYKYMDCTVVFSPHVTGFIVLPGSYTPF